MYQVLARKYRPRNFNELVGQNHVSRALTSALERGRLHHAYLFTGTRGVGKTTIARILAKCLNCETGVTSTPCEVCATCTAVNEGRFIDLIEIDAASRTKVEDTRELLDNVPYAPTQGRFKVYLIDEVHMLSTHSFNALLKTLEEPPEHVKFLFATTDPQKLPITVISRCLQFTLRPLAVDEMTTHLGDILAKEQIQAEQDAIWQIAEAAQGSLRDALSLTDQAIAYGQGQVQHRDVKEMLGLIDRSIIYDLILAIHRNQQAHVSQLLLQFRQQALDVSLVLDQLITTLHELALLQYLPDLALKYSNEINQKIMQLSQQISAQDLQLYYQVACKGRAELQLAVTQEQGFEMCVLRLLAFRPLQANERPINGVLTEQSSVNVQSPTITATAMPISATVNTFSLVEPLTDAQSQVLVQAKASVQSTEHMQAEATAQPFAVESEEVINHLHEVIQPTEIAVESTQRTFIELKSSTDVLTFDVAEAGGLLGLEPTTAEEMPEQAFAKQGMLQSDAMDFPLDEVQTNVVDVQKIPHVADLEFSRTNTRDETEQTAHSVSDHQHTDLIQHAQDDLWAIAPNSVVSEQDTTQRVASEFDREQTIDNHLAQQSTVDERMPQDILKLSEQDLTGEWTLEKWEYWFRNSHLSPAIQELAQHGQMVGKIDGQSTLSIPPEYESLFQAVAPVLDQALKEQWSNSHLQIKYGVLKGQTPQDLNQQRKAEAYQRAVDLLQKDVHIASLMQVFDAQLQNIQLKVSSE